MQTKTKVPRRTKMKGAVGVYRSSSGAYEISYRDSDGKQVIEVVKGATFEEAKAERARIITAQGKGEPVRRTKATFGEFAQQVMDAQGGRPRTAAAHRYHLDRHLLPRFRNRKLAEISTDDIAKLVAEMKQGVCYAKVDGRQVRQVRKGGFSGWTISGTLSTVSLVMGSAKRKGLIPANPVKDLERKERPTVGGDEVRVLEPGEILSLLGNAGPTFRPLLEVLVFSGVRLGECLGLRWMDVDIDGGMMHVRNQLDPTRELAPLKTSAGRRDIEIEAGFGKLLAAHRLQSIHSADTDYLFPAPDGRGRDHRSAGRGIKRAAERAGLTGVSAHTCRHTFASRLIEAGFDPVRVSRRLGHSNPAFTLKTYSHQFEQAQHADKMREAMEKINSGLIADVSKMSAEDGNKRKSGGRQTAEIRRISG